MAADQSFDVVSKVEIQEVKNAIDQATKEVNARFDLKDSHSKMTIEGTDTIQLASQDEYKLAAVIEILSQKLVKRGVSLKNLEYEKVEPAANSSIRQKIKLKQGINSDAAKKIVALIKDSKVKANASRHKAMSYDRMKSEEIRLKVEIAKLLAEAEATDKAEDIEHGPDRQGDELPDELARRQSRLAKIQGARKLLEERARTEAAEEAARRCAEGKSPPAIPPSEAVPDPKDQINFTDPESRIMKASNKGWDQCGNAQAVTNEHQIILAADVTQQANDVRQTVPMVDQTRENLEAAGVKETIKAALGDAGYYSETNATDLKQRGIEPYLATERLKHHEKVASAPRGRIPKNLSAKQRMARKLRTKKGREMYAKRKGMIEPIFGQLKQVLGLRQFSMRGLASMRGEWRLMATVHNLLKLWRNAQKVELAG